jgi:hypothetical protein
MYRCLVGNVDREGAVSLLRYAAQNLKRNLLRYAAHIYLGRQLTPTQVCSS